MHLEVPLGIGGRSIAPALESPQCELASHVLGSTVVENRCDVSADECQTRPR